MEPRAPEPRLVVAELVVTVALPSAVLMLGSGEDRLGPLPALLIALAFPTAWGIWSVVRQGSLSALAVISFASVGITGGVGLFELEARWIAVKEAVVPLLMGAAAVLSAPTRYALVPTLLDRVLDRERVHEALDATGEHGRWGTVTRRGTVLVGLVFVGGAVLSFVLARLMVVSRAGSPAFNEELGRFTAISFPAVALPMMIGMGLVLRWVLGALERCTGREIDDLLLTRPGTDSADEVR